MGISRSIMSTSCRALSKPPRGVQHHISYITLLKSHKSGEQNSRFIMSISCNALARPHRSFSLQAHSKPHAGGEHHEHQLQSSFQAHHEHQLLSSSSLESMPPTPPQTAKPPSADIKRPHPLRFNSNESDIKVRNVKSQTMLH